MQIEQNEQKKSIDPISTSFNTFHLGYFDAIGDFLKQYIARWAFHTYLDVPDLLSLMRLVSLYHLCSVASTRSRFYLCWSTPSHTKVNKTCFWMLLVRYLGDSTWVGLLSLPSPQLTTFTIETGTHANGHLSTWFQHQTCISTCCQTCSVWLSTQDGPIYTGFRSQSSPGTVKWPSIQGHSELNQLRGFSESRHREERVLSQCSAGPQPVLSQCSASPQPVLSQC